MTQQKNHEQSQNLQASQFVYRNDIWFSWANTLSLVKALPGFRSAWFSSDYDVNGDLRNQNGVDAALTANGTPIFSMDINFPMVTFGGADYFVGAASAAQTITGAETHINAASRGLTLAVVFKPDALATGTAQFIAGKYGTVGNHYILFLSSTGILYIQFFDTINGIQQFAFDAPILDWNFTLMQWDQVNNYVHTWRNDQYIGYNAPNLNQLATGNQPFVIAANDAGAVPFSGDVGLVALFDQYSPAHRMLRESALGGWPILD